MGPPRCLPDFDNWWGLQARIWVTKSWIAAANGRIPGERPTGAKMSLALEVPLPLKELP